MLGAIGVASDGSEPHLTIASKHGQRLNAIKKEVGGEIVEGDDTFLWQLRGEPLIHLAHDIFLLTPTKRRAFSLVARWNSLDKGKKKELTHEFAKGHYTSPVIRDDYTKLVTDHGAFLAGVIDAKGKLVTNDQRDRALQIRSTNHALLHTLATVFAESELQQVQRHSRVPLYEWRLDSVRTPRLLERLAPHLRYVK